jgi:hypothetical protein
MMHGGNLKMERDTRNFQNAVWCDSGKSSSTCMDPVSKICVSVIFYKIQNHNIDLRNVSKNWVLEMQKNFSLVKSMPEEPVLLNFVPLKFKELPAVRCQKGLLFNEIVTVYRSFF